MHRIVGTLGLDANPPAVWPIGGLFDVNHDLRAVVARKVGGRKRPGFSLVVYVGGQSGDGSLDGGLGHPLGLKRPEMRFACPAFDARMTRDQHEQRSRDDETHQHDDQNRPAILVPTLRDSILVPTLRDSILVPTLRVRTHPSRRSASMGCDTARTSRRATRTRSVRSVRSHAERGNEGCAGFQLIQQIAAHFFFSSAGFAVFGFRNRPSREAAASM